MIILPEVTRLYQRLLRKVPHKPYYCKAAGSPILAVYDNCQTSFQEKVVEVLLIAFNVSIKDVGQIAVVLVGLGGFEEDPGALHAFGPTRLRAIW